MYIYDNLKSLTIITLSSKTMLKPETFEEEQNSKLSAVDARLYCIDISHYHVCSSQIGGQ